MSMKRRRFLTEDVGEDPTTGIINLTDCMLVLAVAFLVFAIMAMHNNPSIMSETSSGSSQNTVPVTAGETLNSTPTTQSSSGEGYESMGTVYKDPETGNLILVK